ncbi:MAG: PstS family phosphate ABC transporter substrate-binding protein [Actinomycetota bacterium]|nr:PstS family phosphate ABC transporter substrate-binding protein [Actinomycetota bacterium]
MRVKRLALVGMLAVLVTACGNTPTGDQAGQGGPQGGQAGDEGGELSGSVQVDGSSTVAPLTDAIAEEYNTEQPEVTVNVGVSGTGGGFERFCAGETDISDASRPIKDDEVQTCREGGVEYTEVRVGTDALTMVTHPETDFVDCLTTDEVVRIFGPDNPATTWRQVRPDFPPEPLEVFAPGTDSGTYDFMVEEVLGLEASRQDYNASEDDNIIAQGIIGTPNSWGFFGFAYFQESADQLKALSYDAGEGCVEPSVGTAQDDSYKMTRPLFIYVNNEALSKPHVAGFVTFYLETVNDVIDDVGYIAAPDERIDQARNAVEEAIAAAAG